MKVFIGPAGENEVTGGRQIIEIEAHPHDDFPASIAHISLAYIARARKEPRDGTPMVWDRDLPERLKAGEDGVNPPPDDGRGEERWGYVLDEMEWAFRQTLDGSWQDRYVIERGDHALVPTGPGRYDVMTRRKGRVDMDGLRAHGERIREGLRLFSQYMQYL